MTDVDDSRLPAHLPAALARALAPVYARAALARRHAARRHARALRQPVISVGNLSLGGSGKTPLVAFVAGLLRDLGERPAILSRGYARAVAEDGVVVVSDGRSLRADVGRAGDEPMWLARTLPGVAVLVASDRHLAGALAESRLGATVHVLDDGFQHHALARDADLVIVSAADLAELTVPAGRLREPLDVLAYADALVVPEGDEIPRVALELTTGDAPVFRMRRTLGVPRSVEPWGAPPRVPRDAAVLAVAGIAHPMRFFDALAAAGWRVAARMSFADHHRYTGADLQRIADTVRAAGCALVLTTEKDLMRLLPLRPLPVPVAWVPLQVEVTPDDRFLAWITDRLRAARARRDRAQPGAVVPTATARQGAPA